MKKILLAVVLALCPILALAEDITAAERQKLVSELDRTARRFLSSVEGLTPAQLNYRPAPDRWTIAECAEHIAASEKLIRDRVAQALKEPAPALVPAGAKKDEMITLLITDRSKKFQAPEVLRPINRYQSPAATLESFRKERAETVKLAREGVGFRSAYAKHPAFGETDLYGWLLILSGHSERHTLQIEEVKADPDYPK